MHAGSRDTDLVDDLRYSASGSTGWRLEIGDDIVLVWRDHFTVDDGEMVFLTYTFRHRWRPPSRWRGVQRWRLGRGGRFVQIELRPGPCTTPRGVDFQDHVTVRTRYDVLTGCGGPVAEP